MAQGVSNMPAWMVVKANDYARQHGKTPFVIYQAPWSVLQREIEREILPMCVHEGIAIAAYSVLAGGHIRTDEEEEQRRRTGEHGRTIMGAQWERTPEERAVCLVLEKVAAEVGTKSITAVAISYIMHKAPFVFPVVGGRKVEHLMANVEALKVSLTDAHIKAIEDAMPYNKGYPWNVTVSATSSVCGVKVSNTKLTPGRAGRLWHRSVPHCCSNQHPASAPSSDD